MSLIIEATASRIRPTIRVINISGQAATADAMLSANVTALMEALAAKERFGNFSNFFELTMDGRRYPSVLRGCLK